MNEHSSEVASFDFHQFGTLTLTETGLKGTLYSFQRLKQPKRQVGNTIAGNPGEVKVEHPIDVPLDRISRINVNDGLLIGPVVYLWDAFVFLSMIFMFRFIGNCMPGFLAWMKWFSFAVLYGIYWGHNWVKIWVNFHFVADGASYRVLVRKSRRGEIEEFVEKIRSARLKAYASAVPLFQEASREKQVKIGMVGMAVVLLFTLVLTISIGGCGSGDEKLDSEVSTKSTMSKADKIISEYIDSELVPRLRRKNVTPTEIKDMKEQLLQQFQRVEEDRRVETAKYAIHEMIRMNGL